MAAKIALTAFLIFIAARFLNDLFTEDQKQGSWYNAYCAIGLASLVTAFIATIAAIWS